MTAISFHRSLRVRLLVAAVVIELASLCGMLWNGLNRVEEHFGRQLGSHVHALGLAYRTAVTEPLVSRDYATLRDILDSLREAEELRYIAVRDTSGRVVAASGLPAGVLLPASHKEGEGSWGEKLDASFPVDFLGQRYGTVQAGLDNSFFVELRRQLLAEGSMILAVGITLTLLLLFATSLWLTRHLRTLADAARQVAEGDYGTRLHLPPGDEVGAVAESFNTMAAAVEGRVQDLAYQARHDPLTGLHNRRAFEGFLEDELRRSRDGLHVLYLDLDQFKAVNDSCGHAAGDLLLRTLAQWMHERFGADFLARLGGDEFGLVLRHDDTEAALERARAMVRDIGEMPFDWQKQSFRLGASIGLVRVAPGLDTVTALLIAADTACYAAKEHGRNRVELYRPGDRYFLQRQEEFAGFMRVTAALNENRMALYHQRIRALDGASADHAEVLIRMRAEDGTIVPPSAFIPAAERFNLMPAIDRWVVNATLARLRERLDAGETFRHVNINLSGATLADEALSGFIAERIAHHGVDPRRLCFEITESHAIGNLEGALAFIDATRAMGATIALDDFGSGLSSFGYLKRFRANYLKIDGQFIRNLQTDAVDRATVAAMVGLARAHGLRTVAEFIEAPALLPIVRELGVDYAQGFAIHEPEPF